MSAHGDVFGEVYVETVRAAETSGNMTKILEYLAEMLERAEENRRQIRAALAYPVVVVTVLTLATSFLIAFVVPRFAKLFAARGVDLPLITQALVTVGEVFHSYWWAILGAVVGAGMLLGWARRRPHAWLVVDALLHRIPLVRTVLVSLGVARFARVFGLCLSSGLGLIDCLAMSGRASGRPMLERDVDLMIDRVRDGGRLSDVLSKCEYLPPFARRMLSAGEESAELTRMCAIVARQHERDAESLAKGLATIIEPLLVILIAAVVLTVALAIFLPMWNMVSILG
jgi:type II secretory pathway component PulF